MTIAIVMSCNNPECNAREEVGSIYGNPAVDKTLQADLDRPEKITEWIGIVHIQRGEDSGEAFHFCCAKCASTWRRLELPQATQGGKS